MERAALHYLDRYAASTETLRRVLLRKALTRQEDPRVLDPATAILVEEVVAATVRSGLIDDSRFAEGQVASLLRKGTATRTVRAKLRQKGIAPDLADRALAAAEPDEEALARRYAQRRRLGPYRTRPDPARRDRDLAALMRAGFSLAAARAGLAEPDDETGLAEPDGEAGLGEPDEAGLAGLDEERDGQA